jgi:hypothetical protein
MLRVLILAGLLTGCVSAEEAAQRAAVEQICSLGTAGGALTMGEDPAAGIPTDRDLRLIWESHFGPIPARCAAVEVRWYVELDWERYAAACGREVAPATRACAISCGGQRWVALARPEYAAHMDLPPHEWAHAMDECMFMTTDLKHEDVAIWGPDGFVADFVPGR